MVLRNRDCLPNPEISIVHGIPATSGEFIVDTDASNVVIGRVVSQVQDGSEWVIAYFSKTVQGRELLCNSSGVAAYCVNPRAFSKVPVLARVPLAHLPLRLDVDTYL